jgi:hypothetical protein
MVIGISGYSMVIDILGYSKVIDIPGNHHRQYPDTPITIDSILIYQSP